MRIQVAMAIAAGIMAGEAFASSVLVVENNPSSASPSVVTMPEPSQSAGSVNVIAISGSTQVSRSVIAFGDVPAVSEEKVSAISSEADENSRRRSVPTQMVLRGGIAGDALPSPVIKTEPVKELSRPAQRAKERNERRAIREAQRYGEPLPANTTTEPEAAQPATDQASGT